MDAFGWVVVRTSRSPYGRLEDDLSEIDALDERVAHLDAVLHLRMRAWLEANDDPWLVWQLTEQLNNASGFLQFCTNRNHRSSSVWELMAWIAANAAGAYGLVHVRDDEDVLGHNGYGRGRADHGNEFRVWRILNGTVDEHADTLLSPFVPTVDPSGYA